MNSGAKVSVFHIKERIWTVAAFSLIACLGSLVVGMMLGYSTNTLAELSTLWHDNEDHTYGIANGTSTASWFGVSFLPSKSSDTLQPISPCCVAVIVHRLCGTVFTAYNSRHLAHWGLYLELQWPGPSRTNSDVNLPSSSAQYLV